MRQERLPVRPLNVVRVKEFWLVIGCLLYLFIVEHAHVLIDKTSYVLMIAVLEVCLFLGGTRSESIAHCLSG